MKADRQTPDPLTAQARVVLCELQARGQLSVAAGRARPQRLRLVIDGDRLGVSAGPARCAAARPDCAAALLRHVDGVSLARMGAVALRRLLAVGRLQLADGTRRLGAADVFLGSDDAAPAVVVTAADA